MSIQETVQKIKVFLRFPPTDSIIVIVIILVGFAGFGLGRLSKIEGLKRSPVTISTPEMLSASVNDSVNSQGAGEVVGSKNGTKYHFPWCAGAQQIAEKNKVVFTSTQEAKDSGYAPASNCKGLE